MWNYQKRGGRNLSLTSNSKGNVSVEVIMIVTILFAFSIVAIVTYDFFGDIMDNVIADPDISATATAPTEGLHARYPSVFDNAYIIILIALWIGAIVSAFQIDTYPIFMGLSVLALIIVLIVPPILGNAFEETFADETASGLTDSFPAMFFIMTHILEISIFIGASVVIALYAKSRMGI